MNDFRMTTSLLVLLLSVMLSAPLFAGSCPSKDKVKENIEKTFRRKIEVDKVTPSEIEGLCDVQIKLQGQNRIVYTDKNSKYFIAGQIYRASDQTNITKEAVQKLNKFTKQELEKLESMVAFTLGTKGKTLYFVTDPQCPYCKKAESILEPLANEGKIQVKFLFFPLKFHKGAKEECISILCDNKGIEGFRQRYKSDNQCVEGKKKVEETLSFLQKKGINGTPTYIFMNGLYHSGVLQRSDLEKRLGIK